MLQLQREVMVIKHEKVFIQEKEQKQREDIYNALKEE